jgi:hypothetical protein
VTDADIVKELDGYQAAMEELVVEVSRFATTTASLEAASQALNRISVSGQRSTEELHGVATQLDGAVTTLKSFDLAKLEATLHSLHQGHEQSLKRVGDLVNSVSTEQQRSALELTRFVMKSQEENVALGQRIGANHTATAETIKSLAGELTGLVRGMYGMLAIVIVLILILFTR